MKKIEREILNKVCAFYNVEPAFLMENVNSRKEPLPEIRHICIYVFYKKLNYTLEHAVSVFNMKNHTSGIHSIKTIEHFMNTEKDFSKMVTGLLETIAEVKPVKKPKKSFLKRKIKKGNSIFKNGKMEKAPRGYNYLTGFTETNSASRFSKFEPNITIYK